MSAKYLTQFEELTSQGPGDLQRDCTACRQLDAVASALIHNLVNASAQIKEQDIEKRLPMYKEMKEELRLLLELTEDKRQVLERVQEMMKEQKLALEREKAAFESGEYLQMPEEESPPPSPAPSLGPTSPPPRVFVPPDERKRRISESSRADTDELEKARKKRKRANKDVKSKTKEAPPEPKYCKPQCTISDAACLEMVACDNEACAFGEWFHLACVGLKHAPAEDKKWYCQDCRPNFTLKRK